MRSLVFFVIPAVTVLTGCVPVENQRGYVPDQQAVASIQVGMDTKESVSKKLGDPSTAATFGNDVLVLHVGACGAERILRTACDRTKHPRGRIFQGRQSRRHAQIYARGRARRGFRVARNADPWTRIDAVAADLQRGAGTDRAGYPATEHSGRWSSSADPWAAISGKKGTRPIGSLSLLSLNRAWRAPPAKAEPRYS